MRRVTILWTAGCILAAASAAMADDAIPPPWRTRPDTTYQEATFAQPWNVAWETVSNPFGTPDVWMYSDVWQWDDQAEGRQGVVSWGSWENGFSIDLPNKPDPDLQKRVWIQVTYRAPDPGPPDWFEVFSMPSGGNFTGMPASQGTVDHGDGWVTEAWQIVVTPNPEGEFVGVRWTGPGMVDQIIVETICVPEPATLALAAVGGLALALRRRRR